VSDQLHVPSALPQGKQPWCPLDSRLDGAQIKSGCYGEEREPKPDFSVVCPVACLLYRWSYPNYSEVPRDLLNVSLDEYRPSFPTILMSSLSYDPCLKDESWNLERMLFMTFLSPKQNVSHGFLISLLLSLCASELRRIKWLNHNSKQRPSYKLSLTFLKRNNEKYSILRFWRLQLCVTNYVRNSTPCKSWDLHVKFEEQAVRVKWDSVPWHWSLTCDCFVMIRSTEHCWNDVDIQNSCTYKCTRTNIACIVKTRRIYPSYGSFTDLLHRIYLVGFSATLPVRRFDGLGSHPLL
jgi:hypothetical protein